MGVILLIVGIVGFVLSLAFWGSWGGYGTTYRRRTIHHRADGTPVAYEETRRY